MKALKITCKVVLWIVGIVLALVLTLPLWIGPLVKGLANGVAPHIVKTGVNLNDFGLNYYSGVFHMGGFSLENPEGFEEREAVSLGEVRFEMEPMSALTDVVHIKLIRLKDLTLAYVFKDGDSNFSTIMSNMEGEKADEIDAKEPKREPKAEPKAELRAEAEREQSPKSEKKFIIDRIEIGGIVAKIGPAVIPLTPNDIVFTDIGKDSGGMTLEEVYVKTIGPIVDMVAPAVETATMLGTQGLNIGKDGLKLGADGLDAALKSAQKLDIKGATDALKNTGDVLKGTGDNLKSVSDDFKKLFK